jgi:hypothetical protein
MIDREDMEDGGSKGRKGDGEGNEREEGGRWGGCRGRG